MNVFDQHHVRRAFSRVCERDRGLRHFVQAELEQHDVAGRPDVEQIGVEEFEAIRPTGLLET